MYHYHTSKSHYSISHYIIIILIMGSNDHYYYYIDYH